MIVTWVEAEETYLERSYQFTIDDSINTPQSIPFMIPEDTITETVTVNWSCQLHLNSTTGGYFRIVSDGSNIVPEMNRSGEYHGSFTAERGRTYYLQSNNGVVASNNTSGNVQGKVTFEAPYRYNGTRYELNLGGREQQYQLFLPAANLKPGSYTRAESIAFNERDDIRPFSYPVRVYWEAEISDCPKGRNNIAPVLLFTTHSGSDSPEQQVVNESFTSAIRSGSFLLPANTWMEVRLNTGSWNRTQLFSTAKNGYQCRLKISYRQTDKELPQDLIHVDTAILDQYVGKLLLDHEEQIKNAVINESLYDLKLNSTNFNIETGRLLIGFSAFYRKKTILGIPVKTVANGTLDFETRLSQDSSQLGVYCHGLTGTFDIANDLGFLDRWGRSYVNRMMTGKEYWSSGQTPAKSKTFKNTNVKEMVNQALNRQLKPFEQDFLGGLLQVEYNDLRFDSFDLAAGKARANCRFSIQLRLLSLNIMKYEDVGRINDINLDFYTDSTNQNWWAKISDCRVILKSLPLDLNKKISSLIEKRLREHNPLIPVTLPPSFSGLSGNTTSNE